MGLFQKKSIEELEARNELLKVETEVAGREAEIVEKQATIKELKRRYGSGWRSVLGLKGKVDLNTLRSFLSSASKGIKGQGGALYNPKLSPLPRRRE